MRYSPVVSPQLQFLELRDSNAEGITDAAQSCSLSLFRRTSNLFQKVAAKRVFALSYRAIRLAHELRNNVQVAYRPQKVRHVTESLVGIDLFEIRLRKTLLILPVMIVWVNQNVRSILGHSFLFEQR